ncbi:MAG: PAS domain S-box protein [Prolixibacteraceae bacterium]
MSTENRAGSKKNPNKKETHLKATSQNETSILAENIMQRTIPEELAEAYELAQEGFWNFNFADNSFYCTDEARAILDLPSGNEQISMDTISNLLHPAEKIKIQSIVSQIAKNVNTLDFSMRFVLPDGSNKNVAVKSKLKFDDEKKPLKMFGTFRDITEEYYQTQHLKENEELFRSLFNNLTDIFVIFELVKDANENVVDYIYKDVNPIFEMKFDLPKGEILNKPLSQQVQLFQQFHPLLKITAITHEPQQNSFFIQSLDAFVDVLIYTPSENLVATIWRDVSLIVEANSSLRESEEKYRQIFSIGKDGLFMLDFFSGKIIDVNPAACLMFEYSREQLLKMLFKELFTDDKQVESKITEEKSAQIASVGIKLNGTEFPIEASLSYFNWSGRKVVVISIRDISERLKTQQELVQSEKKFKQLFDFSNDAILIIKDYKIIEHNQKSQQIFEVPDIELLNSTLWNLSPSNQPNGDNSRVKMLELLQHANQGNPLHFDWVFEKADKSIFHADIKLSPIFFENQKIIQTIVRDVSPRKKSEEALKLKENRWKQSLEISSTGVWDWNVISNEVYFSQIWKSIIGYKPDELSNTFEEFEKRIHPDDVDLVYTSIEAYFAAKTSSFSVTFRFRCKNGSYKWINSLGRIYAYTQEGKPERFVGTHTDVTRFKLTEQKHLEIQKKYQQTAEMSQMGYWELNLNNMVITAPEYTFTLFGLSHCQQATLKQIQSLIHPQDQQAFVSQFISKIENSQRNCTFRIIIENQTRFIASIASPISNAQETLISFEGIFQDITIFKKDEQQLKDDQKLIKAYLNKSTHAIITIQDEQIVFMNNRFTDIAGFSQAELKSEQFKLIDQIVPEDKPLVQSYFDRITNEHYIGQTITFRLETKSNRIKWLELSSSLSEFKGREAIMYIMEDVTGKKLFEKQLSLQKQQNDKLFENLPIGMALLDVNENSTYFNQEFKNISGLGQPEQKSLLKQLYKPVDYNRILNEIHQFKLGKSTEFNSELELNNRQWVQTKLIPIVDDNNKIHSLSLYINNIDLVKRQIEQLSEENILQKSIGNGLSCAIALFDHNQNLLQFNQNLFSIFDLEKSDTSANFKDFIPQKSEQLFEKVINNEGRQSYVFKTSAKKTVLVDLISIRIKQADGVMLQAIDITEQSNKRRQLTAQLEKFESIFENTPMGIALIDKNRNVIACNKKYALILAYSPEELNHIRLDQIIQTENLSELITNLSELFANVTPRFNQSIQMNDKFGTKHWMKASFAQIIDQFNEVTFAIQLIEDISDSKEQEYSMINSERLKTLNYLANTFAHQFNNQLMAMYGSAYLLKSNLTDAHLLKYAEALSESITKASELTHNLLSFSKNNHKIKVVLHLPNILDELIKQSQLPYNIEVETHYDPKHEIILGDSALLQRAFQNIIENAKDAMPKGGLLSIETKSVFFEESASEPSSLPNKGHYLRIRIHDTGKGIARNEIKKIFDPFFTTKNNLQNAGLGLTIAYKTIIEHGGTVKVRSSDQGSEFMVYLPQNEAVAMREIIQPDEQYSVKGSANLLTIDDEDVVRIVTGELLKKLGYNIFSFASGTRALKFYKGNMENIDLVVLDKHMPEMDGKVVYTKLREMNPNVRVILLTGFNIDNEIKQFFQNSNCQIIQKPVSIQKLSNAISSLMNSQ